MFLDKEVILKRKDVDRYSMIYLNETEDKISIIHEGKSGTIKKEGLEEMVKLEDSFPDEITEKCDMKELSGRDIIIFSFYIEQIEAVSQEFNKTPTIN